MKTFRIKFSLLALSIAFITNAQEDSFKLTDYKLPFLKRKTLETSFSLAGENKHNTYDYNYAPGEATRKTNRFKTNLNITYTDFVNIQKRQSESVLSFYFSSNFENEKLDDSVNTLKYKSNMLQPVFYINRKDRFYFTPKLFFELAPLAHYRFTRHYKDDKNLPSTGNSEITIKDQDAKLQVALKVGKGRVTQVQDARHALYIIEKLKKQNRMQVELTNDEIVELANLIADLKNQRFFDSRIRHIAEIERVDSFLTAHNYISKSDARYFTSLDDIWRYGNTHKRLNGTRVSLAVVPGFRFKSFDRTKVTATADSTFNWDNNAFSIDGGFELVHQKPINLYWQHSLSASAYFGVMNGNQTINTGAYDNKLKIPKIQLGINHGFAFYPNTRTNINMGYQVKYLKAFDGQDMGNTVMVNTTAFSLIANLSAYYYVSPKFRITFSSYLGFSKIDGNTDYNIIDFNDDFTNVVYPVFNKLQAIDHNEITHFIAQFNIGLTYSIF